MKFGLSVIHAWSQTRQGVDNSAEFIVDLAVLADKAGWDGLFLWDHLMFQWDVPMVDPLTTLAAIAVKTKNLRIGTTITPLPRRRPQIIARQLVTIDMLSHGRTILGVGLGAQDLDFISFGEKFQKRSLAEKTDEALDVIERLWSGEKFSYKGKHYQIDSVRFLPKPVQIPRIPIWVGGTSTGALRRSSRYEGWVIGGPSPTANDPGISLEEVADSVLKIKSYRNVIDSFDVGYSLEFPEDESDLISLIHSAELAGVTWLMEGIFGLKFNREEAFERVEKGPPKK
jgi:alkanesulfonate monooxygenase SsuD/methylene tetrahydromethanopterin reductase-like flavin-dependent oxidoreductase (luciferase family)